MPTNMKRFSDVAVKANVLLQCHFSRRPLPSDLRMDLDVLLADTPRLIQAIVDVISSNGWLKPALAVMELSQMVVQGLWGEESPLLQLPHFTKELVEACSCASVPKGDGEEEGPVENVYDIIELEPKTRKELLNLTDAQMTDVARFCNRYPNISVSFGVAGSDGVASEAPAVPSGDALSVTIALNRDNKESLDGAGLGIVYAPLFPKVKTENWWLVVGDSKANSCLAIKRVTLESALTVRASLVCVCWPPSLTVCAPVCRPSWSSLRLRSRAHTRTRCT